MAENTNNEKQETQTTTVDMNFEANENTEAKSNGYIGMELQKPGVSKAESKTSLKKKKKSKFPSWKTIVTVLILGSAVLLGLLIGYYISRDRLEAKLESCQCTQKDIPEKTLDKLDPRNLKSLHESVMYTVSGERIATTLK